MLLGMLEEVQLMQNEPELEAQVQPLYEKAIDILERAPGASSADLALALELDANVLILLKRADAAIQPFGRAKAIRSRRIADMQEATSPVSTTPYRIGGRTGAPHLVSKVEPEYSEEARLLKYQGTVVLSVVVDVDGTAKDIRLVRNLGLGLDEKAVAAVQQWHFQPGMIGSQPVPVQATIEVNFRLL
jgi:TonB family protein